MGTDSGGMYVVYSSFWGSDSDWATILELLMDLGGNSVVLR